MEAAIIVLICCEIGIAMVGIAGALANWDR